MHTKRNAEPDVFSENKPNLLNAQMNVNFCFTMNYEQITMNNDKKKQTQSNPTCSELVEPIPNFLLGMSMSYGENCIF